MADQSEVEEQMARLEEHMERYFRADPIAEANALVRAAVESHNAFLERGGAEIEAERATLSEHLQRLRAMEDRIDRSRGELAKEKADSSSAERIARFNEKVARHNALVAEHRELAEEYQRRQDSYNRRVESFNSEVAGRRAEVEAVKAKAAERAEEYRRWLDQHGPDDLSGTLNRLYVSLCRQKTDGGEHTKELDGRLSRLRRLRGELAAHAVEKQQTADNGLLIVEALLCSMETCHLLVDTGASVTSISPEMAQVLGIEKHVGEEIELSLPNGIRIMAPQLLIPQISVAGYSAEYVKAVLLKESMPGVDGCLGVSFLNRFDWAIERQTAGQRLKLRTRQETEESISFDVFISHKSQDAAYAEQVFQALQKMGHKPFLSSKSIGRVGSTEYQKTIDRVLEESKHLVIVCSCKANLDAPWVEAEWRLFDSLKRSGKKRGNIIPILCGDMTAEDLPLALSRYHAISMSDPEWLEALADFLPDQEDTAK